MSRAFTSSDLVQLPRLDVAGAVALATSLMTVRKAAGPLAPLVEKAANRLDARLAALTSAQVARVTADAAADPERKAADQEIDAAWSATSAWAAGWANLPGAATDAKRAAATRLQAVCFPEGLSFTKLELELEWAESNARLKRIDGDGLEKEFALLGGADFLVELKAAHARYGKALGITAEPVTGDQPSELRAPLLAVIEGIRKYVVAVSGAVDDEDAAAVALAGRLLRPLTEWTVGAGKGAAAVVEEPDAPVAPTG